MATAFSNEPPTSPSSPYGPQPTTIDASSGGADSSPFETFSSDELAELLKNAGQKDPIGHQ